jgi:transmembrane sensor
MESPPQPHLNAQICQEACEWFVEFRAGEPDQAARKAFHAWLRQSPQHMDAYLQVAAIWNESKAIANERWTPDELIAQAVADTDNVLPLDLDARQVRKVRKAPLRAKRAPLLAAASILLALAGLSLWLMAPGSTYLTQVGEQRFITLSDGSTVNLNSRSKIRVRYSDEARLVELLEGQALFEVARSPARPFIVTSGDTRLRAVGTQFDVYRKRHDTIVTVLEGRVAVTPHPAGDAEEQSGTASARAVGELTMESRAPGPAQGQGRLPSSQVLLTAGQQLRVAANVTPRPVRADVARATAWTQRRLVFDSTPLAEVAEEFNRYNSRQLVILDPSLDAFQIDGVFASTDPGPLVRFLNARPDMQVTETRTELRIARK